MISSWPVAANSSYEPDLLGTMKQAFDSAWAEIARNFGDDPVEVESARSKLAEALLRAADKGCADVDSLKRAALCALALSYVRSRPF
jgi:hypothetical protein